MKYNDIRYAILTLLLAFGALTSCIDDDLVLYEDGGVMSEGFTDGYAINLAVSLKQMGGTGTRAIPSSLMSKLAVPELEEIENYIDPEKFRVLVFDHNDKFLFESKSRWIKQLSPTGSTNSQWLVSIPIYTYGNDEQYNWDWEYIREALTKNKFKIAILANRPGLEWCPKFEDTDIKQGWFDNTGPHWGAEHTVWYAASSGNDVTPKDVFDLHHSQKDKIYHGKSWDEDYLGTSGEGFYEFVTTKDEKDTLQMSSTSSWVDWGDNDNAKDPNGWRYFVKPSREHPIPMYGIQEFAPIGDRWIKGTPFNLSLLTNSQEGDTNPYEFKSISLLRSVVKLEFVMPKAQSDNFNLEYLVMGYPNVYARCEPMDVWTPTDKLWAKSHENDCEWNAIVNYGPISRTTDNQVGLRPYQERLFWLYGAWLEKDWKFGSLGESLGEEGLKNLLVQNAPSFDNEGKPIVPRIYNSCIQRNNVVSCKNVDFSTEDYYHYVVYTGERNINDPSEVFNIGKSTSGAATVAYWGLILNNPAGANNGQDKPYIVYKVPLTDFTTSEDYTSLIKRETVYKDRNSQGFYYLDSNNNNNKKTGMQTGNQYYENLVQDVNNPTPKPWPLMRNHIYRTYVQPASGYVLNFTKPISGTTETLLNADKYWTKPSSGKETVVLTWTNEPTISRVQTTEYPGENQKNVATWSNGYSIMIMRSDKDIAGVKDMTINGKKYKGIRLSNGAQNKLTLPDGFGATKMTLYSYRHTEGTNRTCYWKEINGIEYEESNAQILTNTGDASNPDMCEFTFGTPLQEITFTNTGEQLGYVVFLEVEGVPIPYWSLNLAGKDGDKNYHNGSTLKANGSDIGEFGELEFDRTGTIYIYNTDSGKICLSGGTTVTFPKLSIGNTIIIETKTSGNESGISSATNATNTENTFNSDGTCTSTWSISNDNVNPKFTFISGDVDIYKITITGSKYDPQEQPVNGVTRFAGREGSRFTIKSENSYSKSLKFD
ncbi:MAG: hypothetical protein J1E58_06750 [Prevotella sp.]|nr:hypothetical protein [Prevotella sp.]